MDVLFWLAIVLAIVALMAFAIGAVARDEDVKFPSLFMGVITIVLAGLMTVRSSANSVPVRNVGIVMGAK